MPARHVGVTPDTRPLAQWRPGSPTAPTRATQAFTALGHPGYKHFVRLRVRANGEAIDGWCIGMQDPLGKGEEPVLVDRFTWRGAS